MTDWNRDIPLTPADIRDYLVENRYLQDNGDGTFTPLRFIPPLAQPKIMIVAQSYQKYRECIATNNLPREDCIYASNDQIIYKHPIQRVVAYENFCAMPNAPQVVQELKKMKAEGATWTVEYL